MRTVVELGGRHVELAVDSPAVVHTQGEFAGNVELMLGFDQRLSGRERRTLRGLLRLRVPGDPEPQPLLAYRDTENGMHVVFHSPSLVAAETPGSLELRWGPMGESGLGTVACVPGESASAQHGAGRLSEGETSGTEIDSRPITPGSGCFGALLLAAAALTAAACAALP